MMNAMGLGNEPLPIMWTADFIPVDGPQEFAIVEINCSCVGLSNFLAARSPVKGMDAVTEDNFKKGTVMADLIGVKAVEALDKMHAK